MADLAAICCEMHPKTAKESAPAARADSLTCSGEMRTSNLCESFGNSTRAALKELWGLEVCHRAEPQLGGPKTCR